MSCYGLRCVACAIAVGASLVAGGALATELIYTPVNPVFGGNPLNGPVLLNNAQAQNDTSDPDLETRRDKSPLQQLNETLERLVVSRVASAAAGGVIGRDGTLQPGTIQTANFNIVIEDTNVAGKLRVTTTDLTTGQTTSFEVGQ
jgi:curli production assembly/transport component CsgF